MVVRAFPADSAARFLASDGTGFVGYWETAVRRELRADPELAERLGVLTA